MAKKGQFFFFASNGVWKSSLLLDFLQASFFGCDPYIIFIIQAKFDDGYLVMKVIQSWKLSKDESYDSQRSDDLWRFAFGDASYWGGDL